MRALGDIRDGLVAELMRIESHLPSSVVDPVISALLPHFTGAEITALVEAAAKRQMCVAILDAARSVLSALEEGEGDLLGTVADEVDSVGELAHFGVAGGSLQLRGSARTACHVADRFLQAVVERLHESSSSVGGDASSSASDLCTSEPTEEEPAPEGERLAEATDEAACRTRLSWVPELRTAGGEVLVIDGSDPIEIRKEPNLFARVRLTLILEDVEGLVLTTDRPDRPARSSDSEVA